MKQAKVVVETEEDLEEVAKKLLHILYNLRYWTKEWNAQYGGLLSKAKKDWEKKADEYLEKLQMVKTADQGQIILKTEIQNPTNNNE